MNPTKTAIDYLVEQLLDNQTYQNDNYITIDLSQEHFSYLVERAKQLEDIAQKTGERCSSALKEWEKNNQDKKIVRGDEMTSVSSAADEMPVTNAPVTLEAS